METKRCINPEQCDFKNSETKRCTMPSEDCRYQKALATQEIIENGKRVLAEAEKVLESCRP